VLAGAALGAALLAAAEFTPLYRVRTIPNAALLESVRAGSNHAYALIPVALLALFLGLAFRRAAGLLPLLGVGAAGALALAVALAIDLPDARRHSQAARVGSGPAAHFVLATASPSVGLYIETLGAIVLIATCGSGLLLVGVPPRPRSGTARRRRRPARVSGF
jgi:hypothetical protein